MKKTTPRGLGGIRLRNIGKFEFFDLALQDGEIVELRGDNDAGKSTIPLVVEAALFGKLEEKTGANHAAPDGEGTMTVNIGGYEITRVVEEDKHGKMATKSLEVLDATGSRPYEGGAVQTFLNRTFPQGSFINPFALQALPKKEQIAAIVKALPIDLAYAEDRLQAIAQGKFDIQVNDAQQLFDAIARLDKDFREERLQIGRRKEGTEAAYKGALMALPEDFDPNSPAPIAPPAMQDLYSRKEEITRRNIRRDEIGRKLAANEQEIRLLEERVAGLKLANEGMQTELQGLGKPQDTADLDQRIADHRASMETYQKALEVHGDRKRRRREADAFYDQWQAELATYNDLDGRIKALAKLPSELFARTELPIKGLFIEGDEIKLPDENGELQLAESFGDAALLDLYIALAMTLAPIPVILADGLERCGPKRSQEIYDRIRAKGFQLLGTRVTEGPLQVVRIPVEVGGKPTEIEAQMPVAAPEEIDIPDELMEDAPVSKVPTLF